MRKIRPAISVCNAFKSNLKSKQKKVKFDLATVTFQVFLLSRFNFYFSLKFIELTII